MEGPGKRSGIPKILFVTLLQLLMFIEKMKDYDHFGLQDNVNLYKKFLTENQIVALDLKRIQRIKRILEGFQGLLGDFNLSVKTNEPGEIHSRLC